QHCHAASGTKWRQTLRYFLNTIAGHAPLAGRLDFTSRSRGSFCSTLSCLPVREAKGGALAEEDLRSALLLSVRFPCLPRLRRTRMFWPTNRRASPNLS